MYLDHDSCVPVVAAVDPEMDDDGGHVGGDHAADLQVECALA